MTLQQLEERLLEISERLGLTPELTEGERAWWFSLELDGRIVANGCIGKGLIRETV